MTALPIEAIAEPFHEALQQKGRVVVQAPTGSGKSTQLPRWLGQVGRVLVVEPRRMACRALAQYVASLQGHDCGGTVGYAVRFDTACTRASRIVFATPGIALRWCAENGLEGFDSVFLDEFHERRWDTDLLLAILRQGRHRLVVASATVDGAYLAAALDAGLCSAEGRSYPVETEYTREHALPAHKGLESRVAEAVHAALARETQGDVLVFLPGKVEIQAAMHALRKKGVGVAVVPLHAGVAASQQDAVLRPASQQRIILATNVAETSLTLPGVRVVIDSGLERRTHRQGGRSVLALQNISQAAADQRAGRAGRVGPGLCLRLWGRQARLQSFTPPQIEREDLTELVLASCSCGFSPETLQWVTPLPAQALQTAWERVRAMRAVDAAGQLTPHGRTVFALPLDPFFAHLVSVMPTDTQCRALIDLAAALDIPGGLVLPQSSSEGRQLLRQWAPEPCDAWTHLRIMRQDPPSGIAYREKELHAARNTAAQVRRQLGYSTELAADRLPEREACMTALLAAAPEAAFLRRKQAKRRDWLANGRGMEMTPAKHSRFPEDSECAAVLAIHSLPGGRGTQQTVTLGTCLAPVPIQVVLQAKISEEVFTHPTWDGTGVSMYREYQFAGRTLHRVAEAPEGAALRRAVAALMGMGDMWPKTAQRLYDDIQAWNLAVALGECAGSQVVFEDWLARELAHLGLETQEDLAVLAAEDLVFEGIVPWQRKEFDRRFPRLLELEGMRVQIHYDPRHSVITLEKVAGKRKSPPTRRELPPWGRNWTLRFRVASKVVCI